MGSQFLAKDAWLAGKLVTARGRSIRFFFQFISQNKICKRHISVNNEAYLYTMAHYFRKPICCRHGQQFSYQSHFYI